MFVAGGCSIAGQVVLLRELMAAFQGNELSLGGILAAWLLWGALGSWAAGLVADRCERPSALLAAGLVAAALLLPATVFASGLVRKISGVSPTEMISFVKFLWVSAVLLGPLCFVQGGFFAFGSKALASAATESDSDDADGGTEAAGRAYMLESAGSGVGGVVLSLLLINLLPPVALVLLFSAAMLICTVLLIEPRSDARGASRLAQMTIALLAGACLVAAFGARLDDRRWRMMWHPMRLLEARNSFYGSLAAIEVSAEGEGEGETSLYADGLLTATSGSRLRAEELVHVGLAHHRDPKDVLLIGGGLSGCLAEALKHPIERVDYVELDPEIIRLGRRRLLESDLRPLADERTTVRYTDARRFVKTTDEKYDVVIMDLPGPRSARLNRLYSSEFFGELKRVLRDDGIVVFAISSSEVYPSPEQRLLLASMSKTAKSAFATARVLPGEACLFILSNAELPPADAQVVLMKLDSLNIPREYVTWNRLPDQFQQHKIEGLRNIVEQGEASARLNLDFQPIGYLYSLSEWAAHFRGARLQRWLRAAIAAKRVLFFAVPGAILAAMGVFILFSKRSGVGLAVAIGGLSEMVFQLVVLIGFQVLYGYLFYRIGIMVGLFMAGLAAGSFVIWRLGGLSHYRANRYFLFVQGLICVYPAVLPIVFKINPPSAVFMLLPAVAGVIGGLQLPLAVQMVRQARRGLGRSAGGLYGLDLFGSCFGALLAGPILIPTVGLIGVCLWAAMLNIIVLVVLIARQ
jgi:spermidine synthase